MFRLLIRLSSGLVSTLCMWNDMRLSGSSEHGLLDTCVYLAMTCD